MNVLNKTILTRFELIDSLNTIASMNDLRIFLRKNTSDGCNGNSVIEICHQLYKEWQINNGEYQEEYLSGIRKLCKWLEGEGKDCNE